MKKKLIFLLVFLENIKGLVSLHRFRGKRSLKLLKIDGTLAQLVEHRTENPGVPGSIPGGTTIQ